MARPRHKNPTPAEEEMDEIRQAIAEFGKKKGGA